MRKELDAVAAGGDLEALAAGDGGLSAGTFGANHDAANEVVLGCACLCMCRLVVTSIPQGAAAVLSCLLPAADARWRCMLWRQEAQTLVPHPLLKNSI